MHLGDVPGVDLMPKSKQKLKKNGPDGLTSNAWEVLSTHQIPPSFSIALLHRFARATEVNQQPQYMSNQGQATSCMFARLGSEYLRILSDHIIKSCFVRKCDKY